MTNRDESQLAKLVHDSGVVLSHLLEHRLVQVDLPVARQQHLWHFDFKELVQELEIRDRDRVSCRLAPLVLKIVHHLLSHREVVDGLLVSQ